MLSKTFVPQDRVPRHSADFRRTSASVGDGRSARPNLAANRGATSFDEQHGGAHRSAQDLSGASTIGGSASSFLYVPVPQVVENGFQMEVPQIVSQSLIQQKTVEPIVDIPVLGGTEQLVKVPATVSVQTWPLIIFGCLAGSSA